MFDKEEIKKKSSELKLNPDDVERDYIQSWILKEISSDVYLSSQLTLKGSGALRKIYCPETRFARDLDFSAYSHIDKEILKDRLHSVGMAIQKQTGVPFVEEVRVKNKNLPEEMQVDALEARMYFKGLFSECKFDLKTQVDVTQGEKITLPLQYKEIIHPYSDYQAFAGINIRVQKFEEIIATKFITLVHRRKAGDFFDLVYTTFIANNLEINREQIIRTLLSRTNFGDSFNATRDYFCTFPAIPLYAQTWDGLLVPFQSSITLENAHQTFLGSIGNFFDEMSSYIRRRFTGGFVNSILSPAFREKIISSGRQKKIIRLTYSNIERNIEPYKLEYYTRQSDGKTNEYFWGFDLSGGTSQALSIKRFICDKIQAVEETHENFNPRWDIEL
jgi:predicted nucleotidyltransferase component of viral defense system